MAKKQLLLVHPVNPRVTAYSLSPQIRGAPLALGYVAALTPDDWEIVISDENWAPFTYRKADLVGITSCTSSATRAYEIADIYRKQGIPTVLGGMHASMLPEEALEHVDTVVIGEAESSWPGLIADFEAGRMQQVYRGEHLELKGLVKPRRDLFNPHYWLGYILASRGCPFDCEFCAITNFYGRRFRMRPVDEVLDELESIPCKRIWFLDDNILPPGKGVEEWAISLFKGIVERGIKKQWACSATMNFADNEELLEAAARAGCHMVCLGVEACDEDALKEINKNQNLKIGVDAFEDVFRRIRKHGISVLGYFLFGMDSDTPEKMRRRTQYIKNSSVDAFQVAYITPLPGTRLIRRLQEEGRLLYTNFPADWDRYSITEIAYRPLQMTVDELEANLHWSFRQICSIHALFGRSLKTLRATRNVNSVMWSSAFNAIFLRVARVAIKEAEEKVREEARQLISNGKK